MDATRSPSARGAATAATDTGSATDDAGARTGRAVAVLAVVGALGALVAASLVLTGGDLTYSLDDAYIHLSLSEQLRHGTYGLVPGEPSAPASSVLWPLLLVPTAGTALHEVTPLVLTAACLALSVVLLHGILQRSFGRRGDRGLPAAGLAVAIALTTNLVGVALTGMEHSLHILAALAVADGLARAGDGEAPAWWTWLALAALPLVRYEGLAITLPAAAAVALLGWPRRALAAAALGLVGLAGFSGLLVALGLDPLPSSVLVKSGGSDNLGTVLGTAAVRASRQPLPALLAVAAVAVLVAAWRRADRPRLVVAASLVATLALQVAVGPAGWFGRYEVWAVAYGIALLAWLVAPAIGDAVAEAPGTAIAALAVVCALASLGGYLRITAETPQATEEIHAQHGQIRAFARHLDAPVAANDIGLVSWRNPQPVLDLWGLASEDARRARAEGSPGWMERLVRAHDVGAAVIYPSWFEGEVPSSWVEVGSISLDHDPVGVVQRTQVVYATSPEAVDEVRAALDATAADQPPDARVTLGAPPG